MTVVISLILAIVLVALDQLVKHWVVANVALNTAHPLIPHVLALTNLRNYGAAWSILEGQQWFFSVVTVVALAVILYLFYRWR
ncbi:signal peptidase II, partial [Ligilactobacillus aviarius]|uniref:signal peptidase II n=2 Tax=Lactobacillaceae TaxID=33958 RepID=UPI0024BB7FD0